MNIVATEDFAGLPMIVVRDAVRSMHADLDGVFGLAEFAELFASRAAARRVLDRLAAEGFVRPAAAEDMARATRTSSGDQLFALTMSGGALALASTDKPARRVIAERALAAFLNRVGQVEADPRCLYVVSYAVVFGDMLDTARDPVGSVDIAYVLQAHDQRCTQLMHCLAREMLRLLYPDRGLEPALPATAPLGEVAVRRRLKGQSRVLSLYALNRDATVIARMHDVPHRVIYRRGERRLRADH